MEGPIIAQTMHVQHSPIVKVSQLYFGPTETDIKLIVIRILEAIYHTADSEAIRSSAPILKNKEFLRLKLIIFFYLILMNEKLLYNLISLKGG